jgi:hypothetical protein
MNAVFRVTAAMLVCAAAAVYGQPPPAFTVTSTPRVKLTTPMKFWRGGALVNATDLIVIRAKVRPRFEFAPRNISRPLFVYGSTVCALVRSPIDDGNAIMVAPRSAGAETLWLSNAGILSAKLKGTKVDRLRADAVARKRSATIPPVVAAAIPLSDWDQLVARLLAAPPSP